MTKKLGRINLLFEHTCDLKCDCGWNVTIGGDDIEDMKRIKDYLEDNFPEEDEQ